MSQAAAIAIVDDDEGVRTSLCSLLRSLGYEIRSYGSAIDFLADQGRTDPACLIADMQMPRMSGEQLQAELLTRGRTFPMIFMTAFPAEATRNRVMARGARAFLDKPVDGEVIACCLASALAGNRTA
ncbi:response regulator [Xanthomonas campestris pv. phormiicola]|nr:response regulator [Xanthomonas campestris pv. phormiicola]UYC17482.1 response regulator [Xanthomonas campestris pv. phormiicola]